MREKRSARPPATRNNSSEALAQDYLRLRDQIRQASKDLHDHAGSQLAAAGLRLQMLTAEMIGLDPVAGSREAPFGEAPVAGNDLDRAALIEIADVLAGAMESVRAVSKNLSTSPVRALGLKGSLEELTERHGVPLKYGATAVVTHEVGDWIYHIADLVLGELPREGRVSVKTSGALKFTLRIRAAARLKNTKCMAKAQILAKNCGFDFRIDSDQVTMVKIEYAIRRVSR